MYLKTIYLILFVLLTGLASCKGKKHAAKEEIPVVEEAMSKETSLMMKKVMATQLPYTWFAATGQGKIDLEGQRLSARVNVRIQRDKIIWVQLQKLGFEIGRMLITPDSAFFINRFERSYSVYSTEEFLRLYNVPADFEMFSKVFTAGAYLPPMIKNLHVELDGSVFLISSSGVNAQYWFDDSAVLSRSLVTDPLDREWSAMYADYKRTNSGQQFPYKRSNTLVIDGIPNIFNLEYNELVIDVPQEFPFSIPSHYEKI